MPALREWKKLIKGRNTPSAIGTRIISVPTAVIKHALSISETTPLQEAELYGRWVLEPPNIVKLEIIAAPLRKNDSGTTTSSEKTSSNG